MSAKSIIRLSAALAAGIAGSGICGAQGVPAEVQQQLRERESRQHELAVERHRSQEAARPGLTAGERKALERLHADERRQLQLLEQQEAGEGAGAAGRTNQLPAPDAQTRRALDERAAAERREQEQRRFEQESLRLLDRSTPRDGRRDATPDAR